MKRTVVCHRRRCFLLLMAVVLALVTLTLINHRISLSLSSSSSLSYASDQRSQGLDTQRHDVGPQGAMNRSEAGEEKPQAPTNNKKIIYSCSHIGSCGGWADRQKGVVSAYVLAAMLGRRFGVHIPAPCDLGLFMTPNKVNWKVASSELGGPNVQNINKIDSAGVYFTKSFTSYDDLDAQFPSFITAFTWNMEVVQYLLKHPAAAKVGWLKDKSVPEIYRQALNDLFTLKPDLQKELDKLAASRPPNTRLVCAQVRLGKHNGSFPDVESWHTFEQFPILLRFLSKYNDSKQYRILFASDSVEIIQRARKAFPEVVLTIPGPITHTDKSRGPDACNGFKKAILDEYALSTCDVLVISESGIGKVASFLRNSDADLYLFHDVKIEAFTRDGVLPNKVGW